MKICPKCNSTHKLPGIFCSRKCANSRSFSEESKEKKRQSGLKFYDSLGKDGRKKLFEQKKEKYDFDAHQQETRLKNLNKSWSRPYEEMSNWSVRRRLLEEKGYYCWECRQGESWFGKKLTLELDHIDGNNKNNQLNNLRILCPNCHSTTPTFRARNIKLKRINSLVAQR